jgi:hypothetical protein
MFNPLILSSEGLAHKQQAHLRIHPDQTRNPSLVSGNHEEGAVRFPPSRTILTIEGFGEDQSSARDSSCGGQTCYSNSQQLSATTGLSSTEIYRDIPTPWFLCPRRNKPTLSIIREGDPSYGTSSQLPDDPLAAAEFPICIRHHEVSGHRSPKSRSNSYSIGPFVFDQDVNPPCLSHAFNEEKMSGWSPKIKT